MKRVLKRVLRKIRKRVGLQAPDRRAPTDARAELKRKLEELAPYSQPFPVTGPAPRDRYEGQIRLTEASSNAAFVERVAGSTGFRAPDEFIRTLGGLTKAALNPGVGAPSYDPGYVLYGALRQYLHKNPKLLNPNVVEIGTCVGFSTTVMARAIRDEGRFGKVVTIDVIPSKIPFYRNTICDLEGPTTLLESLPHYRELLEEYMIHIQGSSDYVLATLNFPRIHFAFVDGDHREYYVDADMRGIAPFQQPGDILVADDYSETCPDVKRVVDRWIHNGAYKPIELFSISGEGGVVIGMQVLERTDVDVGTG